MSIVTANSLNDYFHSEVKRALFNQQVDTSDHVEYYLVHLLSIFGESNKSETILRETNGDKPLAILYLQSISDNYSTSKGYTTLKNLGDFSLFVSGLFSDFLKNKLNDIAYYISLGSSAYQHLAGWNNSENNHSQTFSELAQHFTQLVDVLGEISEKNGLHNTQDKLRLYEKYLISGSDHHKNKLTEQALPILSTNTLKDIH